MTAAEICSRVAEGESLSAIARDPAMPSLLTMMHWQRRSGEFAAALAIAREARAERFADTGWEMAMEATPETAYLTHVRLGQLRWNAAITSPRSHGRTKPADQPPAPPATTHILFKHFRLEEHPQTGLVRMVTYLPDPETGQPERVEEGPWGKKPGGLRRAPDIAQIGDEAGTQTGTGTRTGPRAPGGPVEPLADQHARAAARHPPRDPEGWL